MTSVFPITPEASTRKTLSCIQYNTCENPHSGTLRSASGALFLSHVMHSVQRV